VSILLLLLAAAVAGPVAAGGVPTPASPLHLYTPAAEFERAVVRAVADCPPGTAVVGHTPSGLPVVTVHTAGRSEAARDDEHAVRGMLLFGEHARELVTSELALVVLADLCAALGSKGGGAGAAAALLQRFSDVAGGGGGTGGATAVASAAATAVAEVAASRAYTLLVVPLANAWGRSRVQGGDMCRRTNAHDVDLNRNYDAHWLPRAPTTPADSNPGPAPFSEGETQDVRSLMDEFRPHVFLSVHSGAVGMYTPPAYTTTPPPTSAAAAARDAMVGVLRRVAADTSAGGSVPVGAAASQLGYLCPGTCLDYSFDNARARFAFAFEIFDRSSAPAPPPSTLGRSGGAHATLARFAAARPARLEHTDLTPVTLSSCFMRGTAAARSDGTQLLEVGGADQRGAGATAQLLRGAGTGDASSGARTGTGAVAAGGRTIATQLAADGSLSALMTPDECLSFFNPVTRAELDATLSVWRARVFKLLQHAHAGVTTAAAAAVGSS